MDDKSRIYTIKNPANAVMTPANRIAMKAKTERSLFLRIAINPVTRLVREQIPAIERGRRGRGKLSTNRSDKSWNIKNNNTETTIRIMED